MALDPLNHKKIAALQGQLDDTTTQLTAAQTLNATLTTERDTAVQALTALNAQHEEAVKQFAALQAEHTALKGTHEAALTAHKEALAKVETDAQARITAGITDGLASQGVPADSLPAAGHGSAQIEATAEELRGDIRECKDPIEAGKLVKQLKALSKKN